MNYSFDYYSDSNNISSSACSGDVDFDAHNSDYNKHLDLDIKSNDGKNDQTALKPRSKVIGHVSKPD